MTWALIFFILKVIFLLLFKDFVDENLHRDVYDFAKHKCVVFSNNNKVSLFPFSLLKFEKNLTFLIFLGLNGFYYLVMIVQKSHGFSYLNQNVMRVTEYPNFAIWSKPSVEPTSKDFGLIVQNIFSTTYFYPFLLRKNYSRIIMYPHSTRWSGRTRE